MKKLLLVLTAVVLLGGAVSAQDQQSPVRVDFSSGLYYDAYPLPDLGGFEFLAAIFNLRAGGLMGIGYNSNDFITVGGEIGIMAMYWEDSYGYYTTLFDVPLHAFADLHLGEAVALRVYGGGIGLGVIGNSFVFSIAPEAGARLSLGGLYVEAAQVFTATPFLRYGIGFTANAFTEQ